MNPFPQGKGNKGKFIDRGSKILAAGLPSAPNEPDIKEFLNHYTLQDDVDSLLGDTVYPKSVPTHPSLYDYNKNDDKPIKISHRYDPVGNVANLLRTEPVSKPHVIAEELKNTVYRSFWKKPLGTASDPAPGLPAGFDYKNTVFGKKTDRSERLCDVLMPKTSLPDMPPSFEPGYQKDRKYCRDFYDPNKVYGSKKCEVPNGAQVKSCFINKDVPTGGVQSIITNSIRANACLTSKTRDGKVLAPINNINYVPEGYRFGIKSNHTPILEHIVNYEVNSQRIGFLNCLKHLNKLRLNLGSYENSFFHDLFQKLKYFDKDKSGWIPIETMKKVFSNNKLHINIDNVMELLVLLNIVKEESVNYDSILLILNKRSHFELPKFCDFDPNILKYTTTYREMVKQQPEDKSLRADLSSGRNLDKDVSVAPVKAVVHNLPQETDVRSCLYPSLMTKMNVSGRDMYEKREPDVVKEVFTKAGYSFTDDEFMKLWNEAQKLHSKGWVCFETFRKVINEAESLKILLIINNNCNNLI